MRGSDLVTGRRWGREDRRMFKKGDINGNKVLMCIRRVASVTLLKAGITKEDKLSGLSGKFILARSEYVDKTSALSGGRQKRG